MAVGDLTAGDEQPVLNRSLGLLIGPRLTLDDLLHAKEPEGPLRPIRSRVLAFAKALQNDRDGKGKVIELTELVLENRRPELGVSLELFGMGYRKSAEGLPLL